MKKISSRDILLVSCIVTTAHGVTIADLKNEYETVDSGEILKVTSEMWHNRLGHPHVEAMKKINHLKEMKKQEDCETCFRGKFKRLKFPHSEDNKTDRVLQRRHSAVVGPMSIHEWIQVFCHIR